MVYVTIAKRTQCLLVVTGVLVQECVCMCVRGIITYICNHWNNSSIYFIFESSSGNINSLCSGYIICSLSTELSA